MMNKTKAEAAPAQVAQHTPGPWTLGQYSRHGTVPVCSDNVYQPIVCDVAARLPDQMANARLIAAAPDLLRALQDMVEPYAENDTCWQIEQARAAIAKAEGRQS